mgnify:CR=1 FL=1
MNKQELIEKINNLQYSLSWNIPRINKETVLDLIEQLDEPKKVVVPQFVADWIEEARKACKDVAELFEFDFTNDEVGEWFMQERPFDLVARAWLDGYEVEKEKRPIVIYKADNQGAEIKGRVVHKEKIGELYTITIQNYGIFVVSQDNYEFLKIGDEVRL